MNSAINLVDPADPLEQQNAKLFRIVEALMNRVERNTNQTGNAFALFQRSIALEEEVKARTRDLQKTLDELNTANEKLAAASAVAEEANRAKSRFVAAASHDVRQPLNAAKLFLGSLTETGLSDNQAAIVSKLSSALDSVEGLIGSLLDISRLDSATIEVQRSRFPIGRILDPLLQEFTPLAIGRGLELRRVDCGLWVESDPYYLRQIIQNILSNAIRYTERGRVLVGCRRRQGQVFIEVHDTGPGIRREELPLVFEEFRRLPRANGIADNGEGAGLGLAIVKRACSLLDHGLELQSEQGRGTRFSVGLPACSPIAELPPSSDGSPAESAETLIAMLIADDAELVTTAFERLEQWSIGTMQAGSLNEAERLIEQLGMIPDVVLIDYDAVQEMDFSRLDALLRSAPNVAIIDHDPHISGPLPRPLREFPLLQRSLPPHRLRAVLFRGAGGH